MIAFDLFLKSAGRQFDERDAREWSTCRAVVLASSVLFLSCLHCAHGFQAFLAASELLSFSVRPCLPGLLAVDRSSVDSSTP